MASTLRIWTRFEVVNNGVNHSGGSLTEPTTVSLSGEVHDQTLSVGTEASVTLYDASQDIGDFDFLCIVSDGDVELELVVADGEAGEVVSVVPLKANIPFVLGADNSRESDHVDGWGTVGTADNIERISAYNASQADTAIVRIFSAT